MLNIEQLKFDKEGLIPAIVVDAISKKVLTLAYMNKESLKNSKKWGEIPTKCLTNTINT